MNRKILFVINPNAGKKNPDVIIKTIHQYFPPDVYYQITVWKDKNNFDVVARLMLNNGFTHAVAVGGDGTVNQVAKTILGSEITLGIIPVGSGNGLARTLGIHMNTREALLDIYRGDNIKMDYGVVNEIPFFCTSGVGFDAHIGSLFASAKKRGLSTYIKMIGREMINYKSRNYKITINNEIFERRAYLITIANAGQYGNDFYIAPQADITDGFFHIAIIKPLKIYKIPGVLLNILRRRAHLSTSIETFKSPACTIEYTEENVIHVDGEPRLEQKTINYKNVPGALSVVVGSKFPKKNKKMIGSFADELH